MQHKHKYICLPCTLHAGARMESMNERDNNRRAFMGKIENYSLLSNWNRANISLLLYASVCCVYAFTKARSCGAINEPYREVHIGARLVCCGGVAAQHMHNKVAFIYDTMQTWQISFDRGLRFIYRNECNIYNII